MLLLIFDCIFNFVHTANVLLACNYDLIVGERTVTRNCISHLFESRPKLTVWKERKELMKDLLTVVFPRFSSLALTALKIAVTHHGCEAKIHSVF